MAKNERNTLMEDRVEFEVIGGCCSLQFDPGASCGSDADCNPGIGFGLVSTSQAIARNGKFYAGVGVFGRADAARLRDMLNAFLQEHPAED